MIYESLVVIFWTMVTFAMHSTDTTTHQEDAAPITFEQAQRAALESKIDIIVRYIGAKGDVNCADWDRNTLLHKAAASEFDTSDIISLLLEAEAHCNAQNRRGKTPLHVAIESRNIEAIQKLVLAEDIKADIKDFSGKTARQLLSEMVTAYTKKVIEETYNCGEKCCLCTKPMDKKEFTIVPCSEATHLGCIGCLYEHFKRLIRVEKKIYAPTYTCAICNNATAYVSGEFIKSIWSKYAID